MNVTSTGIAVSVAVVIALGFLFFGPSLFAPFSPQPQTASDMQNAGDQTGAPGDTGVPADAKQAGANGQLMITDTHVGTGAEAVAGKMVTVKYVGKFQDGTVFDASDNHPETKAGFSFPLGAGRVIQGWDQGVVGMKVGGIRHLVVPPELGYGPNDYGTIPGNSTLEFDVELLDVK